MDIVKIGIEQGWRLNTQLTDLWHVKKRAIAIRFTTAPSESCLKNYVACLCESNENVMTTLLLLETCIFSGLVTT